MKWIGIMSAALAMTAIAAPARAAANSDCPLPPGAVQVALPSGLPYALRSAVGNVALPGQPFNSIDIFVQGQPNRRYIFVWNIGARWIVATEVGGIALHSAVSVYKLGKDDKTATLIDGRTGFPKDTCVIATKLASARDSNPKIPPK